jgi:hypothetical protein
VRRGPAGVAGDDLPLLGQEAPGELVVLGTEGGGEPAEAPQTAFRALAGRENLEERLQEGPQIDAVVLHFLRERFR